jgi:hypothetical protein
MTVWYLKGHHTCEFLVLTEVTCLHTNFVEPLFGYLAVFVPRVILCTSLLLPRHENCVWKTRSIAAFNRICKMYIVCRKYVDICYFSFQVSTVADCTCTPKHRCCHLYTLAYGIALAFWIRIPLKLDLSTCDIHVSKSRKQTLPNGMPRVNVNLRETLRGRLFPEGCANNLSL